MRFTSWCIIFNEREKVKKLTLTFDNLERREKEFIPFLYQKVLENVGDSELEFVIKNQKDFIKIKVHESYKVRPSDNFIQGLKSYSSNKQKLS